MTNDLKKIPSLNTLFAILVLIFSLLLLDVLSDAMGWYGFPHVFIEITSMLILFFLIAYLGLMLIRLKNEAKLLESNAEHWKDKHQKTLKGMSENINQQFGFWKLTASQKEIGILVLKGLSFKEIAEIRNTSERTVRQQATEMYKKAELNGRHEFSAFFLEDLLLP